MSDVTRARLSYRVVETMTIGASWSGWSMCSETMWKWCSAASWRNWASRSARDGLSKRCSGFLRAAIRTSLEVGTRRTAHPACLLRPHVVHFAHVTERDALPQHGAVGRAAAMRATGRRQGGGD